MTKRLHIPAEIPVVASFDIERRGLQLIDNGDTVNVFTDPFCSTPAYLCDSAQDVRIFSDYEGFLSQHGFPAEIDPAGFWEIVLFGLCLGSRTIFKNISQLPPAAKLTINKRTCAFTIEKYWNFGIKEDGSISSKSMATEGLHAQLCRIFNGLDRDAHFVMGLSGGLDSRLSLAFLSERVPPEHVSLFTFGFDDRLLEYEVAQKVAARLGFERPQFYRMLPEIYREALAYMPFVTGGEISIAHCHILSYFKGRPFPGYLQLSNYYSDAVFGFSARAEKVSGSITASSYHERLANFKHIDKRIAGEIAEDITRACEGYDESANFSSINEYLYVTERTPKFHMRLAYGQAKLVPTLTPYADIGLLKYMISVPLRYREQKNLLDEVFKKYYPSVQIKNVGEMSSRFDARFSNKAEWLKYRSKNLLNGLLRVGTGGRLQVLNRQHTEELDRLLFSCFRQDLHDATETFLERGLITPDAKSFFDRLPLRAVDTGIRYNLISLASLFAGQN